MTTSDATFGDLGVPDDLVAVLDGKGITAPFAIQQASIPDAIAGRDVLGRAPTGSGKTLAFGIPMVARIGRAKSKRPTGLILSPTRELAEQIRRELEPLARVRDRSVLAVYGGVGMDSQRRALRKGLDLLVACPGRLLDLIGQGECSLDSVEFVVIDEADRMADMGFLPVVKQILDMCSSRKQTVLFSATLGKEVKVLTDRYQNSPITHQVGAAEPDLSLVEHRFILTQQASKIGITADLVDDTGPTVIFCRTRHGVDRVARQLKRVGVKAGWIHGGRSQNQRDSALRSFTDGKVQALVATDVAARGIHVDGVACVIHFDPPSDPKDYVHRSGRTARAGAEGLVVSYINPDQKKGAIRMLKDVGLPPIPFEEMPDVSHREPKVFAGDDKGKGKGKGGSRSGGGRSGGGNRSDNGNRSGGGNRSDNGNRSGGSNRSSKDGERSGGTSNANRTESETRPATKKTERRDDARPRRQAAAKAKTSDDGMTSQQRAKKRQNDAEGDWETTRAGGPSRRGANKSGSKRGRKSSQRQGAKAEGDGDNNDTKRSGKRRPKNKAPVKPRSGSGSGRRKPQSRSNDGPKGGTSKG